MFSIDPFNEAKSTLLANIYNIDNLPPYISISFRQIFYWWNEFYFEFSIKRTYLSTRRYVSYI